MTLDLYWKIIPLYFNDVNYVRKYIKVSLTLILSNFNYSDRFVFFVWKLMWVWEFEQLMTATPHVLLKQRLHNLINPSSLMNMSDDRVNNPVKPRRKNKPCGYILPNGDSCVKQQKYTPAANVNHYCDKHFREWWRQQRMFLVKPRCGYILANGESCGKQRQYTPAANVHHYCHRHFREWSAANVAERLIAINISDWRTKTMINIHFFQSICRGKHKWTQQR